MNAPTVETIVGQNLTEGYEPMLRESISFFLKEPHRGGSDFSALQSISYHHLHTMEDPPFGVLWFYSAMSYHSFKAIPQDPSKKLLIPKDLFQILLSSSTLCNALKKVALLAPVIYVVNNSVIDLLKTDLCLGRQIESLLERVISYISMCCALDEQENGSDELTSYFVDLIRVWTMDQVGDSCKLVDDMSLLSLFFPLLSDEVRLKINVGCRMDYLAGVVMNEIFLLRLQLKLGFGMWGENLRRDMGEWAVQTIKRFQNFVFFGELFNTLLLDE